MNTFDLAVIGAGPAGYAAALRAAAHGKTVALIEKQSVGGVCLGRGCVPAKIWIAAAETVDHAHIMNQMAAEPFDYAIDYSKLAVRQKKIVSQFTSSLEALLKKRGVTVIDGTGHFAAKDSIAVTHDNSTIEIKFKNALIASGTAPVSPFDLPPDLMLDNSSVFDIESLPASILIVGAGAIGCEFAGALARFGIKVILIELMESVLPMGDREISTTLAREFKKKKIGIHTGAHIDTMTRGGEGVVATLKGGTTLTAEKTLVSIGRSFNTANLGLDRAGVETDQRGAVITDKNYKTTAPGIYAAGDVAGKHLLAYTATAEGVFVADTIAGENPGSIVDMIVPAVVFTIPEIGSVGITEEAAPPGSKIGRFQFRALARAHATGEISGFVKIIAHPTTDTILGVHIIGPRATDMIHIASVAMTNRMTAKSFGDLLFAHPTYAEAFAEAAHDCHGISIHQ